VLANTQFHGPAIVTRQLDEAFAGGDCGLAKTDYRPILDGTSTIVVLMATSPWRRAALSIVTVAIAFTVWHFGVNQSVVQSGKSADGRHDNLVRVNSNQGEPAGPVELRLALSRSFEDFEMALRQNDQLLATREPMVVPSKSRSAELQ